MRTEALPFSHDAPPSEPSGTAHQRHRPEQTLPYQVVEQHSLQTVPARLDLREFDESLASANGFSLHAGVAAEADQRVKLERLCRYISRPTVSVERLSLTAQGRIRYALKAPYRDCAV